MRKPRVTWTSDQFQYLLDTVCDLRNSDPEPSLFQIIKIAQEIIFDPKDRKLITQTLHVQDVINEVKKRYGKGVQPEKYVDKYKELEKRVAALEKASSHPKLKIAVAGYKNNQYNELKKEFEDRVEILYVERSQVNPSFPTSANYIIIARDFISHRFTGQVKNRYDRSQIFEIEGTTESAKRKIMELIS